MNAKLSWILFAVLISLAILWLIAGAFLNLPHFKIISWTLIISAILVISNFNLKLKKFQKIFGQSPFVLTKDEKEQMQKIVDEKINDLLGEKPDHCVKKEFKTAKFFGY